MEMSSLNYVCKPKHEIDTIDLKIIRCLSRNCRASYTKIASIVGLTPNAIKERISTMVCNDIIQSFIVNVNPSLFGYEKECFLTLKHFHKKATTKTISEDDIIKQLNLLGDVRIYAKLLERSAIFVISLRPRAEDKITLVVDLLKQSGSSEKPHYYLYTAKRISFRDIAAILKKQEAAEVNVGECGTGNGIVLLDKQQQSDDSNNKSPNEKATKAYKLFSEGKKPVQVAIELGLREKQVDKLYREFCKLKNLNELYDIYPQIEHCLPSFLKLHKALKKRGLNPNNVEWFADAIV